MDSIDIIDGSWVGSIDIIDSWVGGIDIVNVMVDSVGLPKGGYIDFVGPI